MKTFVTAWLLAGYMTVSPSAVAQTQPEDDFVFEDVRARDTVPDGGSSGDDAGSGPVCSSVQSSVSRTGTAVSEGYRYNYLDGGLFRVSLTTAQVWQRMYRTCRYPDGTVRSQHIWVEISEPDPAVLIPGTVEEVTERVFAPEPALSPVSRGIVNVGMWLAVEGGDPVSATASASDTTWAQTTATLRDTTFDFGNGDSITCAGAGDPIPEWAKDSAEPSPICGYTYRSTNGGEPYRLTITSTWSVVSTTSAGTVQQQPDIVLSTTIDYVVREVVTTGVSG